MHGIVYSSTERPEAAEYIEFLRRAELGGMYPKKDFEKRITHLLRNASVVITARDGTDLVGVCLGMTDHAYFLFITDIGVARGYERQGIGREVLRLAHEAAGGAEDITSVTWSNSSALAFYAACGLTPHENLVARLASDWELFDIRDT